MKTPPRIVSTLVLATSAALALAASRPVSLPGLSLARAIELAQRAVPTTIAAEEVTLEFDGATLVWKVDLAAGAKVKQVVLDASSGALVRIDVLDEKPAPAAARIAHLPATADTLDKVLAAGTAAAPSAGPPLELALQKEHGRLTWQIDFAHRVVALDAETLKKIK